MRADIQAVVFDLDGTLLDRRRSFDRFVRDQWERFASCFPNACVLFPDAAQTLSVLRTSGLKLGLITNGSIRMQSRKLQWLALAPMLDAILISDAEGISKPDPQIFHRVLERLNVSPPRSVFVGDHPEVDVAGARAAGMQAIWRRDPSGSRTIEADGIIDELSDLLAWLGLTDQPNAFAARFSLVVDCSLCAGSWHWC